MIWNPLTASSRPDWGRSAQRKAAEITEQIRATAPERTGAGVSDAAAADTDATGEVEAAGRFRIYLGAAPGVGKTYAMLSEGQRRRGRGADVVAGFVEAYGRPATEELIDGLEVIPRKAVGYRGRRLKEMDLDATTGIAGRCRPLSMTSSVTRTSPSGRSPSSGSTVTT